MCYEVGTQPEYVPEKIKFLSSHRARIDQTQNFVSLPPADRSVQPAHAQTESFYNQFLQF